MERSVLSRRTSLVKVGGALGIAASLIAIAVFTVAMFRLEAILMLSFVPLLFGALGLVISIIGGVTSTHHGEDETHPISALFVCALGIIGGALELYVWMHLR
jgi:hypothetical protein